MVLAAVLGAVIFRVAATKLGEAEADLPIVLEPPVDPEIDHIRGPEDAQLTLVEFVDFECGFCAHATGGWDDPARPLRRRSALRGPVTYRWWTSIRTHWLPHMQQRPPHGSTCSGNGWTSCSPAQNALARTDLIGYAAEIGLDVDQFVADLDSDAVAERVQRDISSAPVQWCPRNTDLFRRRLPNNRKAMTRAPSPKNSSTAAEALARPCSRRRRVSPSTAPSSTPDDFARIPDVIETLIARISRLPQTVTCRTWVRERRRRRASGLPHGMRQRRAGRRTAPNPTSTTGIHRQCPPGRHGALSRTADTHILRHEPGRHTRPDQQKVHR